MAFRSKLVLETDYSETCTPGAAIFGVKDYAGAIAAIRTQATKVPART